MQDSSTTAFLSKHTSAESALVNEDEVQRTFGDVARAQELAVGIVAITSISINSECPLTSLRLFRWN